MSKGQKLAELADQLGYDDVTELLEAITFDEVDEGICINKGCDYTTRVEPDSRSGWCEECKEGSVWSGLTLAGVL